MPVSINVQADQAALAKSIAQGVAQFNSGLAGKNQLKLKIDGRSFSQPLGRITDDLNNFESAMKASNARVLAFGASTAVLGGLVKVFKDIADATVEVEKGIADINRILNLSLGGLQKFSSELFDVARSTAVSFDQASKAALEFSRQGLATEEVLRRTSDALTLVRLTGIDAGKAVSDLTAAVNGFAREGLTTSEVLNKVVAVEQKFAVSARDITEALSRAGQSALEAGADFNQLNALVATAQQTTARGGSVIGNALKTIFTRLQRGGTLDQLEKFNVQVRDIEGNILPSVQILQNFAKVYDTLGKAQKAYLSEQVAGVYQVNILKALVNDLSNEYGVYNQALMVAANATNEANVANEKLNQTLSSIITQTGTSIKQLGSTIGTLTFEPLGKQLLSALNTALKFINDTIEGDGDSLGSNFARGLLEGFKTLLVPGLIAVFKLVGQVAARTLKDLSQAIPAVMGITTQSQKRQQLEKSILTILQGQGDVSKALQGLGNDRSAQARILLGIAKNTTVEYQKQVSLAKSLSSTLASSGVSVGSRGLQTGKRIKAGGFIPAQDQNAEMMGALMGGYSPGKVVKSPVGGVMNTAEDVKYVAGFSQPFINPPASSKAGKTHRSNSIAQTGVDPYASLGFIPNFAARKIIKFPGETEEAFKARVNEQKKGRDKKKTGKIVTLDTKGQIGLLSLFGEGPRGTTNAGVASVKAESLSGAIRNSPTYKKLVGADYKGQISLKNIQLRALDNISDLSGRVKSGDFSNFTKRIDEELLTATSRIISKSPLARVFPNPKISATEIKNNLAKDKIWDDIFPAPVQGSMFEYAIRAGTKTSKEFAASVAGDKNAAFDFEESGGASSDFKNLFGFSASKVDGKRTSSLDAVNSLVRKSFNSGVASKFTKLSSLGFIPNFASKKSSKDSVMSLEEKLSGEKAMFYNEPFPHVRNASQPSFSKAMSDHGGMIQALKDSYAMQSQTGIISNGFIPNFAIPTIPGLKSMDVFGKKFQALTKLQQQQMQNLNSALQKLATSTNLTADQQRLLVNDVRTNAKALEANTGSTTVITKANQALATAKAAQTAATQAATTATMTAAAAQAAAIPIIGPGDAIPTAVPTAVPTAGPKNATIGPTRNAFQKYTPTFSRGVSSIKGGFQKMGGGGGAGLIGASFAAPMLAGQISSSITRGRDRSELTYGERLTSSGITSGTSGAITGALIGSSILPGWGTAIGAAVGGLTGLAAATMEASTTLKDLRAVGEKRVEREMEVLALLSQIESLSQPKPNETREQEKERIRQQSGLITELSTSEGSMAAQIRKAGREGNQPEVFEKLRNEQQKSIAKEGMRTEALQFELDQELSRAAKQNALNNLVALGEEDDLIKNNIAAVVEANANYEKLRNYLESDLFKELDVDFQNVFKSIVGNVDKKLGRTPQGLGGGLGAGLGAPMAPGVTGMSPTEEAPDFKENIALLKLSQSRQKKATEDAKKVIENAETVPSLRDLTNKINTYLIKLQGETQRALEQASISQKLGRINETFNQTLLSNVQSPIEIFKRNSNFLKGELEAAIKANQKEIRSAFITNISGIANKIQDPKTKQKVVELLTGGDSVDSIISKLEQLRTSAEGIKFVDEDDVEAFKNALEREKENQLTQQTINQGKRDILSQETQVNLQRLSIVEKERENIVQAALANAQRERFLQAEASTVRMRQADRAAMLNTPQAQNLGIGARADLENQIAAQNAAENIRLQKASQLSEIGRGLGGETEFSGMREGLQQKVNEKAGDVEVLSQEERNKYDSELQSIEELKDAEIALNEYRKTASEENLQKVIETREAVIKTIEEREGETTKVRELKTEVENLKRAQDEIKQGEKEINAELERQRQLRKAQVESRTTAKGGFERAKGRIQQEIAEFPATFAENTTIAFRDGLVDAMKSAADGTKSIKDGLLDAASSFLGKMNDMLMQNIANHMTMGLMGGLGGGGMGGGMGGLGGMFGGGGMGGGMGGAMGGGASTMMFKRGGFIRAQNGMYISGGRIGDKNPALLEDGEYVLNRNAVKGMGGPSAIDALNFGMMPRFAENAGLTSGISAKVPGFEGGGKVTSARIKETGEARLSKTVDLMDPKGGGNFDASATVNLAADSDRLSAFALDNDVYIKRYMKQQQEIQARRDAKRRAKKEKRKALIRQAITTAIMMGVSAGVGAIGTGAGGATSTSGGALGGGVTKQTFSGLQTKNPFSNTVTSQNLSADIFSGGFGVAQRGGLIKANKGGYIPYGNRLTDSIPAMLAGGEYIVNSKAVRKYGVGGLNKVNAGLARFQEGGLVGGGMDAGPIESDSSSSSTNNISVNITVNNQSSTGKSSEEKSEDSGVGSKESESEKAFNLSQKIKSVVMEVLNKEQRAGGMLSSTKGKS